VYSLLNTAVEWIDHDRTSKGEDQDKARFESAVFGSGAKLKAQVFHHAVSAAQA